MATGPLASPPPLRPIPIGPSIEEWRAMAPTEREHFLIEVNDVLSERRRAMVAEAVSERRRAMVATLEAEALQATAEAERAATRTELATAEAERAMARVEQALAGLHAGVLAALDARGIACPEDARALVMACDDPSTLLRWVVRAMKVSTLTEVLAE